MIIKWVAGDARGSRLPAPTRDSLAGMETAYLVIFALTFVAIAAMSVYVVRKLYE